MALILPQIKAPDIPQTASKVSQSQYCRPNNIYTHGGVVREDGRVLRDMYVMQTKSPSESKYPFDYYKLLSVIPGKDAFRPLSEGGCPFVKSAQARQ
jgi:branched-chain amino acid transport system substrate-binding protein